MQLLEEKDRLVTSLGVQVFVTLQEIYVNALVRNKQKKQLIESRKMKKD